MFISTEAIFQFKSLTSFAFKWMLFSFRVFRPLILSLQIHTHKPSTGCLLSLRWSVSIPVEISFTAVGLQAELIELVVVFIELERN